MGGYLFVRSRAHLDEEPDGAKRHARCDARKYDSHWRSSSFL
jgi:hypothetical protein